MGDQNSNSKNLALKPDVMNKTILRSFKRFHALNFKKRALEVGFSDQEISKTQIIEYSTNFYSQMLSDFLLSSPNSSLATTLTQNEATSFLNKILKACYIIDTNTFKFKKNKGFNSYVVTVRSYSNWKMI